MLDIVTLLPNSRFESQWLPETVCKQRSNFKFINLYYNKLIIQRTCIRTINGLIAAVTQHCVPVVCNTIYFYGLIVTLS